MADEVSFNSFLVATLLPPPLVAGTSATSTFNSFLVATRVDAVALGGPWSSIFQFFLSCNEPLHVREGRQAVARRAFNSFLVATSSTWFDTLKHLYAFNSFLVATCRCSHRGDQGQVQLSILS